MIVKSEQFQKEFRIVLLIKGTFPEVVSEVIILNT